MSMITWHEMCRLLVCYIRLAVINDHISNEHLIISVIVTDPSVGAFEMSSMKDDTICPFVGNFLMLLW